MVGPIRCPVAWLWCTPGMQFSQAASTGAPTLWWNLAAGPKASLSQAKLGDE